jgi:hypothetical protein
MTWIGVFGLGVSGNPGVDFLDSQWFFSVTPFPDGHPLVPVFRADFSTVDLFQITETCDCYPTNQPSKVERGNPDLQDLMPRSFLIFVELSETTRMTIHSLCRHLRAFAEGPRRIWIGIICFGETLRFPILNRQGTAFSIASYPDLSESFPLNTNSVYFSLVKHRELFFEYLNALERFPSEKTSFALPVVLNCCLEFFKNLRSSIQFIVGDLPDPDPKILSSMTPIWIRSSVSVNFLCIGDRSREVILEFVNGINGLLTVYQTEQFDKLAFDIVRQFLCPRVLFTVANIALSKSLQFVSVAGRGIVPQHHIFQFAKLGINDTIHFQIKPKPEKFNEIPPKIVFVFRYLDSELKCYHRIIPVDCRLRPIDAEESLTAAAVKIALKKIDPQTAITTLLLTDLSQFDILFRTRFQFALRSLNLIPLSASLINFVIGQTPSEIFDRLSPLAFEFGTESWRAIKETPIGLVPVIIKCPFHCFLVVLADGEVNPEIDWNSFIHEIDKIGICMIIHTKDIRMNSEWKEITQLLSFR